MARCGAAMKVKPDPTGRGEGGSAELPSSVRALSYQCRPKTVDWRSKLVCVAMGGWPLAPCDHRANPAAVHRTTTSRMAGEAMP